MQVKRFLAADMRRALELVRQELGADAVILSSNRTPEGVELLTTRPEPASPPEPQPEPEATGTEEAGARRNTATQQELDASAREFLQPNQRVNAGIRVRRSLLEPERAGPRSGRPVMSAAERYGLDKPEQTPAPAGDQRLEDLQAELTEMRYLLEEQMNRMLGPDENPGSPLQASIGRRLERMGLPRSVSDQVLRELPADQPLAHTWSSALARVARSIPADSADPVAGGGVYALVGPTGAGKTTTIGKLAARYVMEHGPQKVALVTLDTYRIGGHDQLRSLARILGVGLKVVQDPSSLETELYRLRRHQLVLIDTAGFRPGDARLSAQLETLARLPQVRSLMVLPGNGQAATLKAAVHAYGGEGLDGCVLSKLDETASLGEALGVVMQGRAPIVYTTHGQDIPRDIEVARAHQLATRAAGLIGRRGESRRTADGRPKARAV